MPRPRSAVPLTPLTPSVADIGEYRHKEARRKNIAPAGLAAQGRVTESPKHEFAYNPHRPPVLRFDPTGAADQLPELLHTATQRSLTPDEARLLADALRKNEPWLEWAGKQESKTLYVDPVALHLHERVSAQAILKVAMRQDVTRSLFADPEQEYREAVQFYQHDIDWTNRMILGDSLSVMTSLAQREDLAGKVQCIYMDPPYGIKYGSNFQSEVGKRDVKDGKPEDLTREAEMVKAYRDTWNLGVHSYLAYLRDRLMAAKELLADSGSIFVQISDENLHRVRAVMDEVFGSDNAISVITLKKMGGLASEFLAGACDYIIWYCKNRSEAKYRQLYLPKILGEGTGTGARYDGLISVFSERKRFPGTPGELNILLAEGWRAFQPTTLTTFGSGGSSYFPFAFQEKEFYPSPNKGWLTTQAGLGRLSKAGRIIPTGNAVRYVRCLDDFAAVQLNNVWTDIASPPDLVYVVQTSTAVIERCLLMTTDPGDLVLDPTCGSGTTAYVAEQWGRRWITTDTSRVALAIARQRLLTAKFDFYALKDAEKGVGGGFRYKTVPHITLKSIAQNIALDPLFAKWEPILTQKLAELNHVLSGHNTPELRARLRTKLADKERREGKKAITDADRRRWILPDGERGWQEWEVPLDTDPDDWPAQLSDFLTAYRQAWRGKMDAVNAAIAASAEQEELVDQPQVERNRLRVSGPFTVEGVMPVEENLDIDGAAAESPIGGEPVDDLDTFGLSAQELETELETAAIGETKSAEAYLDKMIRLLGSDAVRFPDNKDVKVRDLRAISGDVLHAEGLWEIGEKERQVAVVFGPQYGPVTAQMVEECIPRASRLGYDDLVIAGFSFDGAAQALIQDDPNPRLRLHLAHIRPDVNMGDLLKTTANSQLFTVSGLPRAEAKPCGDGQYVVHMEGVDIYDPVGNTIIATGASKVAAWFLDSDYDGRTFCITQAFFPDKTAWAKLSKALANVVDEDRFAAFAGTVSLPFPVGKYKRAAVKVIDPRGNEVLRVLRLSGNPISYNAD